MTPARGLLLLALLATPAFAQSQCESKCHQQASDCMKTCTGDPKDAQKPEQGKRLMQCLNSCQAQTRQCKEVCPKPAKN
jgi:hypothetical protein